jgi:hypothetical protein
MRNDETDRQTVEQQIALTYRHIARQHQIIQALRSQGYPTDGAERLLDNLKHRQERHKALLARLLNSTEKHGLAPVF